MTIAIIVLVVLAIFIFLLALPLEIKFFTRINRRADFKVRFKYFWGFVSWETGGNHRKVSKHKADQTSSGDFFWLPRIYRTFRTRGVWDSTLRLIKGLSRHIKIRSIDSEVKISLGDDYYTGMMVGLLLPVSLFVSHRFEGNVNVQPAFEEDLMLDGYLNADVQVRPIEILAPCIAFIFSPPVWRERQKYLKN